MKTLTTEDLNSDRPGASTSGTRRIVTFVVTEAVEGQWSYHWSSVEGQTKALCGKDTMPANIDPTLWGGRHPTIAVDWCKECEAYKERILPELPDEIATVG